MINERLSKYPSLWPTALHSPHGLTASTNTKDQVTGVGPKELIGQGVSGGQLLHACHRVEMGGEADSICMIIANWVIIYHLPPIKGTRSLYGCFLKWWVFPPISHPIVWSFLVGKAHGFVGETHHFRVHPQMDSRCFLFKRHFLLEEKHGKKAWFKAWKLMLLMF